VAWVTTGKDIEEVTAKLDTCAVAAGGLTQANAVSFDEVKMEAKMPMAYGSFDIRFVCRGIDRARESSVPPNNPWRPVYFRLGVRLPSQAL